ncbi:MAG TPA: PD-(D/E)XK nuclease family protein [Kangiella sp.]
MQTGYRFDSIDPEQSIVITASQRLARHLREEYNRWQAAQGKTVWATLQVMPWGAFTATLWELLREQLKGASPEKLPHLLSDQQSQFIWQDIIERSQWNDFLLNINATSSKAWQAWQQHQQWQLDITQSLAWDKDTQAFKDWANEFRQRLDDNHWIDSASSINLLLELMKQHQLPLAHNIYTAGFEQITPQQQKLFEQLGGTSKLEVLTSSNPAATPTVLSFNSAREEFKAVINQAKDSVVKALKSNPDKPFRCAIVVPELEKHKALIDRLLWQELTPSLNPEQKSTLGIYDISLGEPLSKQPLVVTALNLFKFLNGSIETQVLQQLLLSPYFGKQQASDTGYEPLTSDRARLEKYLRKSHKQRYAVSELNELAQQAKIVTASFSGLIESLKSAQQLVKEQLTLVDWMKRLIAVLDTAEWPGSRTLHSREYQIQQTFYDSFNQLRQFQVFYPQKMSFSRLLELLSQIVTEKQFHQELPKAPIQIMGLLETLGLEFDHVWLTGATYQVLPAQPNPNPFIDKQTLKQHQMPGSSAQREFEYAQQLIASLLASSHNVTISYPRFEGSSELLPSPFIAEYSEKVVPANATLAPTFIQTIDRDIDSNNVVERYQDDHGMPLAEGVVKGGTGFFRDQINCPFKAYMSYRLRVKEFEEVEQGLNAMERGSLVHSVLEAFWKEHDSNEILLDKSDSQLSSLIEPYLTRVLDEYKDRFYYLQLDDFADNEFQRLLKQLTQALQIDARRLPFTSLPPEQDQSITIEGLTFNLKVDRIDEVDDGLLIIDYKTGTPTRAKLYPRDKKLAPEEPQLALYAINQGDTPIAGVSFFNINAKEIRYQGIADTIEHLALDKRSAIKEAMCDIIDRWQLQMSEVARDIKAGTAIVDPRNCDYCDFASACRINQRKTMPQPKDDKRSQGGAA